MNYRILKFELPRLNLKYEELTDIIKGLLANMSGSFDFSSFVKKVASHLVQNQIGFNTESNTSYEENLDANDVSVIREIVWDFIILRYITPGSYGRDEWPALTITKRGKAFFAKS